MTVFAKVAAVALSASLAGGCVTVSSKIHTTPSGQRWEALSVETLSGYQIISCPLNGMRVVISQCFASSGASVANNVLTALVGTVLPTVGIVTAKGTNYHIGSTSIAASNAEAGVKIKN